MIIRQATVNNIIEFRIYEHGQIIARFESLSRAQAYVEQVEEAEQAKQDAKRELWGRKSFDEWVAIARKRGYKVGWARFRFEAQEARYGVKKACEVTGSGAVGDGTYWVAYSGEADADTLVDAAKRLGAKGVIYSRADNMVMVR